MSAELELLPLETLSEAAECLKVIAHPVRLRMVEILMQGEFPVHELARMCDLPPHQACEHLRLMRGQRLLASERRGRAVYYRIESQRLPALIGCLRETCHARNGKGDAAPAPYSRKAGSAGMRPGRRS